MDQVQSAAIKGLKTGWSYLSWGVQKAAEKADDIKLADKISSVAYTAKNKAVEVGLPEMATKAAKGIGNAAVKAGSYTYESGQSIYKSHQEGTLKNKTAEKASDIGSSIG
jgi:hypothetical protein